MKANKFFVSGVIDTSRVQEIKESIHSHDGVNAVRIDMQANTITVDYDEARYNESDVKSFVSQAGLNVSQIK